jgi:hypothetical protein
MSRTCASVTDAQPCADSFKSRSTTRGNMHRRNSSGAGGCRAELSEYISTTQAGEMADVTRAQIQWLLRQGRLQGTKVARNWLVYRPSLSAYLAARPRPGLKLGQKVNRPQKIAVA